MGISKKKFIFSRLNVYLPFFIFVGAILFFISYLSQNAERYRQLFNLSADTLSMMLILVIIYVLSNGAINFFFYRVLKVRLNFNESVGLAAVNTMANMLPFAGGLIAKGVYLKQRYQLAYAHFLSATMALYVCFVAANGIVGLTVLGIWTLFNAIIVSPLLVLGFLGMGLSVFLLFLPLEGIPMPDSIVKRFLQLTEGWRILRRNQRMVAIMIGLQIALTGIFAARFWLAFHALSQDVTFAQCLLFSSATILTRLVSIAPGGLGVREGLVAAIGALLGFDPGISAVAVGLDRLISTSIVVFLGSFYSYLLSKNVIENNREID